MTWDVMEWHGMTWNDMEFHLGWTQVKTLLTFYYLVMNQIMLKKNF